MSKEQLTTFDVVLGVNGPCLYVNGYRIDGPKPYAGKFLYRFTATADDLRGAGLTPKRTAEREAALLESVLRNARRWAVDAREREVLVSSSHHLLRAVDRYEAWLKAQVKP